VQIRAGRVQPGTRQTLLDDANLHLIRPSTAPTRVNNLKAADMASVSKASYSVNDRPRQLATELAALITALTAAAWTERGAIYIQLIGGSGDDHRRRAEYLVKGTHLKARLPIQRKRSYQGRIFGKRCGASEDIGLTARLRRARSQAEIARSIPF
jgi:hypothetical protein